MIQDARWPTVAKGTVRIRFTGGALSGAVVDLPEIHADTQPGQLILTGGGAVYDRADNCRPVPSARVLRPAASARPMRTPVVNPHYL